VSTYRITFTDGRTEDVTGDHVSVEGGAHVVIRDTVMVIGKPRAVVVRRLTGAQVTDVSEV
jgi:hypothetical protein